MSGAVTKRIIIEKQAVCCVVFHLIVIVFAKSLKVEVAASARRCVSKEN